MTKCSVLIALAGVAASSGAAAASAKEYVDYSYGKGVWEVNLIEVDPNHIDDYLTGLKQSDIPVSIS